MNRGLVQTPISPTHLYKPCRDRLASPYAGWRIFKLVFLCLGSFEQWSRMANPGVEWRLQHHSRNHSVSESLTIKECSCETTSSCAGGLRKRGSSLSSDTKYLSQLTLSYHRGLRDRSRHEKPSIRRPKN